MFNVIALLLFLILIISPTNAGSIDKSLKIIESHVPCQVIVTSSTRTIKENRRVGGAKYSYHLLGRAFDIISKCLSPKELYAIVRKYTNVTTILYPTHLHIDNRKHRKHLIYKNNKFHNREKK